MSDESENELTEINDMVDFGTGINVITITYTNNSNELPRLDIGDCSIWTVASILRAAIDTLDILVPPLDISSNGELILGHSVPKDDEEEIDYDEDEN